MKTTME